MTFFSEKILRSEISINRIQKQGEKRFFTVEYIFTSSLSTYVNLIWEEKLIFADFDFHS